VYKVKERASNVVDLIKGQRIHLIINTPTGLEPWFDGKSDPARRSDGAHSHHYHAFSRSRGRGRDCGVAARRVENTALQQLHAERAIRS